MTLGDPALIFGKWKKGDLHGLPPELCFASSAKKNTVPICEDRKKRNRQIPALPVHPIAIAIIQRTANGIETNITMFNPSMWQYLWRKRIR